MADEAENENQGAGVQGAGEEGTQGDQGAGNGPPRGTEPTPGQSELDRLKSEAAERRIAAREAEEKAGRLQERLFSYALREATEGILEDADTFILADHEPVEFEADDGTYDVEKMREVAEGLAKDKPSLAKRKAPAGDIGQGVREEPPADAVSIFTQQLREAAG